jgi:hypothetical protein
MLLRRSVDTDISPDIDSGPHYSLATVICSPSYRRHRINDKRHRINRGASSFRQSLAVPHFSVQQFRLFRPTTSSSPDLRTHIPLHFPSPTPSFLFLSSQQSVSRCSSTPRETSCRAVPLAPLSSLPLSPLSHGSQLSSCHRSATTAPALGITLCEMP